MGKLVLHLRFLLIQSPTIKPVKVYVKFDDEQAAIMMINRSNDYATENKVVPIVPVLNWPSLK